MVFCGLVFKKMWRYAYFTLLDKLSYNYPNTLSYNLSKDR
jgi:hypothetical protein